MSLFVELKRRNVIRVGIAYGIVAWVILQVADVMIDNIGAPDWLFRAILLVLAIGFPVVLVFAWAFELTPEGIKREKDVDRSESIAPQTGKRLNTAILVLMALAITYLLFDKFSSDRVEDVPEAPVIAAESARTAAAHPTSTGEATAQRQSIAVLPFENRSSRSEDEYFTAGIHDDLLTTLSRIRSLKVISRTSVLRYRDTEKPIPEIARELGVATIMEGAVQRAGNQVRINVQLIDAQTDEHLWAEIFDRELTAENLFAIQSEISGAIATALRATLSPEEQNRINSRPTDNLAAYDAYLRGRQLMETRISDNLAAAIEEFREAVTLDPEFALAWVGLADSYNLFAIYGSMTKTETMPFEESAVERALEIDPNLGEAYASLSNVHEYYGREAEREAALRRAIELNPNYATAYHWYAQFLSDHALRADEQLAMARRALELDPGSPIIQLNAVGAHIGVGALDEAMSGLQRMIDLHPGFSRARFAAAFLLSRLLGRVAEGIEEIDAAIETDPGSIFNLELKHDLLVLLEEEALAVATLEQMESLSPEHPLTTLAQLRQAYTFGNEAAFRESFAWAVPRLQAVPFATQDLARSAAIQNDWALTRQILLENAPGWMEPSQWQRLISREPEGACVMAAALLRTGNTELGQDLLDQALIFHTELLPEVTRLSDVYGGELCYLASGDEDRALQVLEKQLEQGQFLSWTRDHRLPLFDPLRDEPRYQALIERRERLLDEQRALVRARYGEQEA